MKSWNKIERHTCSLKHVVHGGCFAVEDGASTKQLKTITDDIVFRNRDADGVEAPTLDHLVISVTVDLAIVRKVLVDCSNSVNIV